MANKPSTSSKVSKKSAPNVSKKSSETIVEPVKIPENLSLLARFGGTSVTPGFSLARDKSTGLIIFSTKEITEPEISASSLVSASTFADVEAFFRKFSIAHSRDIYPE
jgi:hypothetical protein